MTVILKENFTAPMSGMPILCFLHLPRTGGTTINRMLKYAFGDRAFFHADLVAEHGGEAGLATALANDNRIYSRAEHAALSLLTLNQALDAVPEFAVHCQDAQLRTLFNATDRHGITAALQRYPYLLGRMEALDVFAQRLLESFGLTLGGVLPRINERPVLAGVAPARSQADYATALARLERQNRAELEFFARLPPIFATMPRPAMALARAS